jgi:carbamoyl-phosphate synthase large subunit
MKIAISGLNATDNPAPGLPVAKSLTNHKLIGFSYDPNEPANYLDNFKKKYLMPYPALGFEELKNRLEYITQKEGQIDLIIPCLDAELPLYIKYQKELAEIGIKTFLPDLESFELRNKNRLAKLSKELNLKYPNTFEIGSIKEMTDLLREEKIKFPFMVKGNYYKAYKANTIEEAIEHFYTISNEWGFPVLLQESVTGEEINLVGVADGKGNLKGAVSMKKLTTTSLGKIWSGITIDNPKLLEVAKEFVKATKWRGPFELECMANGNEVYMIEINPRFPAWVYFATGVGINLPEMVVKLANGEEVEENLNFPIGKMYMRFTDEVVVDYTQFMKLLSTKEL